MKRTLREILWILAISGVLTAVTFFLHPRVPAWFLVEKFGKWDLKVEDIREILGPEADRIVWIDARNRKAFDKGHIEGARLLNPEDQEQFAEQLFELQDLFQEIRKDGRPVIVYCDGRICERSEKVAAHLRESWGLEPVYLLRGNWRTWK